LKNLAFGGMLVDIAKHKNWRVRVTTSDRRAYEGNLVATDRHSNMLLTDTEMQGVEEAATPRYLGLVALRGEYIRHVELLSRHFGKLKS